MSTRSEAPRALCDLVADPAFGARVLDIAAQVPAARLPTDALALLHGANTAMGVEQSVFVSFLQEEDSHESYRFLLAADPAWCFEYQANAWYSSDPWLIYSSMHSEVTCASRIELQTAQQRLVQALAERHGMVSVCIAPAASPGGNARIGMLAMGTSVRGHFETEAFTRFAVLARALSMELHEWWARFERNRLIDNLGITAEELYLLRLEVDGHGTKRAADELGLTGTTVNSRWQRLNRKLGSPHRHQSGRLATKYGLI